MSGPSLHQEAHLLVFPVCFDLLFSGWFTSRCDGRKLSFFGTHDPAQYPHVHLSALFSALLA